MRQNFQGALSPLPPKMYSPPAIPQNVACYRVLKPVFLDDTMYFEGDIVTWTEEPNSEMEPLNDLAMAASKKFFDKCEELGKLASALRNTLYVALQRPYEKTRESANSEARRVELIKGDGGVPVMGARKRGRPKAQKLEVSPLAERPIANLAKTEKEIANSISDGKRN